MKLKFLNFKPTSTSSTGQPQLADISSNQKNPTESRLKNLLPARLNFKTDSTQFIYAIFVIILVPLALAFNTIFLLKNIQRDTDFEINNKASLVTSVIEMHTHDKLDQVEVLKSELTNLTKDLDEVAAIELFKYDQDKFISILSTSPSTTNTLDQTLNQLAWGQSQAFSKQIKANFNTSKVERVWLVAMPLKNSDNKKIGVINLYMSAAQIDAISERTTIDSLIVLSGTILIVFLLLLNHFKFFETSLLFKKLREVDQLKDEFISIASHELKTPLTNINNYTFMLLKNPVVQANQEIKKYIDVISHSSKRLKDLVDDILDVSRIEQNRMVLDIADYNLVEIVDSVLKEMEDQAKAKGLQLSYDRPTIPVVISCDKNKMFQVILNLVSNALKYTPMGSVLVYHTILNNQVKTFVKDTGVGISEEDREKLFSKFHRIYNEKTKDVPGTGLGLWITKQTVEKMGGKVSVESIENQGSQFIITFPLKLVKTPTVKSAIPLSDSGVNPKTTD